jgi:quercetin dioxygenase-like cupin family protein
MRRTPPRERFVGSEHLFDLAAEAERLRAEPAPSHDGHRQITLFAESGVSIVLFDFDAGGSLRGHSADGLVNIEVLSGELEIKTSEDRHLLPAGSLLVLRPRVAHDVRAVQATRMLLTVTVHPTPSPR